MSSAKKRTIIPGTRRLARRLVLTGLLLSATALAGDIRYQASRITSKSPEQLWSIMTDYAQTCDKGCKYKRPDLVVVKKIPFRSGKDNWYTWSHVSTTLKDVTYFTHVTIVRKDDGNIVANNRQVAQHDKELIATLEKHSGLKHAPAFDAGNTQTVTETVPGGKTKITQVVTLTASGVLALWEGKIRAEMKENIDRTFENIGD